MHAFIRLTLITVFLALMSVISFAQSAVTGAVSGSVTDPNNAVIANATVILRSVDTNKEEKATTDNEGRFRFANLQPGTYAVTITATGFAEYKREQITVEVGRASNIDATLKITGAEATVEVVADSSLVNVE